MWPTTSMIPVRKQRYSYDRSGHEHATEAGTAALRCGCWRRNRACAARASFGPARRRRLTACGPPTTSNLTTTSRMRKRIDQVIAWLRLPAAAAPALHHPLLLECRSCRASIWPRQPADRRRGGARRSAGGGSVGRAHPAAAADRSDRGLRSRHGAGARGPGSIWTNTPT